MNCREAKLLMFPFYANDPDITSEECNAFRTHLQGCLDCANEYEINKKVLDLVKKHWTVEPDEIFIRSQRVKPVKQTMTTREGWEDLLRRCPDLGSASKHQKRLQLLHRVGSVAACLAMGFIFCWYGSRNDNRVEHRDGVDVFAYHNMQSVIKLEAMAAKLHVAAKILSEQPKGKHLAESVFRYIVDKYPDTSARKEIDNSYFRRNEL